MATDVETTPATSGAEHLKRDVGLIGLLWASGGSVIGSGWLFGAQGALAVAGPAALISWGIGAAIIIVLALVHAELGGMFALSGGTGRFPHYSFGGAAGASFGWFSWLQAAAVTPVEVIAMIQYAQHWHFADSWMYTVQNEGHTRFLLSHTGMVIAVVLLAVMVTINLFGIRMLSRVNSTATWWKVGIPLLTIFTIAATSFHASNFSANGGFMAEGWKNILLAIPFSGIVFSMGGFEQAIQLAGESQNPKKHLPRATMYSLLIGVVIFILIQVVFTAALPQRLIAGGWSSTASTSYTQLAYPLAGVAMAVSIGWLAAVLYIDAVISPGGTALIYATTTSRISYGLARNGYVPAALGKLNRQAVPWVSLVTAFVTGCIFLLPFPSWQSMIQLITSAGVMMYAGAPLAFGAFRNRLPDWERPFRLPGGKVLAPLAFALANMIILWSGWDTDYKLGISVLIGYVVLIASRLLKLNPIKPELDFRAAQWLPVYLIGMGVISWQSQTFDNPTNLTGGLGTPAHPWLGFGWDMAAVAVFSLLIYFWAQAVALPTERIKGLIDEVVVFEAAPTGH
jgi:amino acid transporter